MWGCDVFAYFSLSFQILLMFKTWIQKWKQSLFWNDLYLEVMMYWKSSWISLSFKLWSQILWICVSGFRLQCYRWVKITYFVNILSIILVKSTGSVIKMGLPKYKYSKTFVQWSFGPKLLGFVMWEYIPWYLYSLCKYIEAYSTKCPNTREECLWK